VVINKSTEASRAKHKFAVKRNSWPKTRGVAMNPVDHVRLCAFHQFSDHTNPLSSLTVVVITSISERPPQSHVTLHKVKRLVSLLPEELVCSVVHKRSRTVRLHLSEEFECRDRRLSHQVDSVERLSWLLCILSWSICHNARLRSKR
jgi:hypothetical protein